MATKLNLTDPRGSDANLVRLAREGEHAAFSALFEAHKTRVYSLCLGMTGDLAQAEWLTQQVFLQAFRRLASFHDEVALSTWLIKVTAAHVLMHLRKRSEASCNNSADAPAEQVMARSTELGPRPITSAADASA